MSIKNEVYCVDNMEYMSTVPDKFFDLAVVDPPYGNGEETSKNETRGKKAFAKKYKPYECKRPDSNYFKELFRISKNQIIWGGNYFINDLYDTSCMIIWDKENGNTDYADCELAWTSFNIATRIFKYRWAGMLQGNMRNKEIRIHRHQKPIALYKWLLKNYTQSEWKIFDSHVGSGSSRIACYDMGFDFIGTENDPDYWQAQEDRYKNHISQTNLFPQDEMQDLIFQGNL